MYGNPRFMLQNRGMRLPDGCLESFVATVDMTRKPCMKLSSLYLAMDGISLHEGHAD